MTNELWPIMLAGFLGSAHCLGMCGVFALAISNVESKTQAVFHELLYFTGKTLTYAILGALIGFFGARLGDWFPAAQQGLSFLAGGIMIVLALGLLGLTARLEDKFAGWTRTSIWKKSLGYFLGKRNLSGSFGLGLLNGLLPCGLVYGVLAYAVAAGGALKGAFLMTGFGLATIPALFVFGMMGNMLSPKLRMNVNKFSGIVVLLLGLMTIIRATPLMHMMMNHDGHEGHSMEQMDNMDHMNHDAMPMMDHEDVKPDSVDHSGMDHATISH